MCKSVGYAGRPAIIIKIDHIQFTYKFDRVLDILKVPGTGCLFLPVVWKSWWQVHGWKFFLRILRSSDMAKMEQNRVVLTLALHICYVRHTRRHACQWAPPRADSWTADPSMLWLVAVASACRPVCMVFVWWYRETRNGWERLSNGSIQRAWRVIRYIISYINCLLNIWCIVWR